jgi:hypothetical protein
MKSMHRFVLKRIALFNLAVDDHSKKPFAVVAGSAVGL